MNTLEPIIIVWLVAAWLVLFGLARILANCIKRIKMLEDESHYHDDIGVAHDA